MIPKINGMELLNVGRLFAVRKTSVSLINNPEVNPTNFNASFNDPNVPVVFISIFHWRWSEAMKEDRSCLCRKKKNSRARAREYEKCQRRLSISFSITNNRRAIDYLRVISLDRTTTTTKKKKPKNHSPTSTLEENRRWIYSCKNIKISFYIDFRFSSLSRD